jgi:DNA-binding GntR family transcriptional regulator
VRAADITETVSADITTMSESVSLSCDRHTPLLVVTRTARNEPESPSRARSCA